MCVDDYTRAEQDYDYYHNELDKKDSQLAELQIKLNKAYDIGNDAEQLSNNLIEENNRLKLQLDQAKEIINNPDTLIFQQSQLIESLMQQLKEFEEDATCYTQYKREHERRAYLENIEVPRLEDEIESYQKQINDICNENEVGSLEQLTGKIRRKTASRIKDELIQIVLKITSLTRRESDTIDKLMKKLNEYIGELEND